MALSPPIPDYTARNLSRRSEDFLAKYHPSLSLPVPIEEIIEFQYQIDIVPLHGLHRAFEIDGYISSDLTTICIDDFVQESRPGRYRFTLAHEIGHLVLHRDFFQQHIFVNVDEWKKFVQSISPRDYGTIEWQAYQFAGLILVPPKMLRTKYNEALELARNTDIVRGKRIEPPAQQYIASWLARQFVVSSEVIERCVRRDKL